MALLRLITFFFVLVGLTGCLSVHTQISSDEKPEIVEREFVVVAASNGLWLGEEFYPSGMALEVIAHDDKKFSVVAENGRALSIPRSYVNREQLAYKRAAWDKANHRWTFHDPPEASWLVRYFHWTQMSLARAWPFALTLALLSLCLLVATFSTRDWDSGIEMFLSMFGTLLLLLFIGSCQGNNYYRLYSWNAQQSEHLEVTADGFFHPFPASFASIAHTIWYDLGLILWVPSFVVLHIVLVILVPLFIQGATHCYYRLFVLDGRIRWYQSASEVVRSEIAFRETRVPANNLELSVAVDGLRRLNRILEEQLHFLERDTERGTKEDQSREEEPALAVRLAEGESFAEVLAILERDAGDKQEEKERVSKLKRILEQM